MSEDLEQESEQNPTFIATFSCFPLVKKDQKPVERGGKILLPVSALDWIDFLNIPYPLMFKITNSSKNRFTHAGVFEFTAEEGLVIIPSWMMKFLDLKPGEEVTVENVSLPSATYCRIEPLTRNFSYVSDAKSVLEQNLKYFSCITEGDVLFIHEINENQVYKVKVVETRPESAVNVFDCDMELELAIPEKPNHPVSKVKSEREVKKQTVFKPFQGQGHKLDGSSKEFSSKKGQKNGKRKPNEKGENEPEKKKARKQQNKIPKTEDLRFIREKQKEFVKQQSKEKIEPFQGKGHSLKDD